MKKLDVFFLVLLTALLSSCQIYGTLIVPDELVVEGRSETSPTGAYVLEYKKVDTNTAVFEIYTNDDAHQLVYASDHNLHPRFTNYIMWDENVDRVWMYDGDTGIYFTERMDGAWVRYTRSLMQDGTPHWLKDTASGEGYSVDTMEEYPGEVTIPAVLIKLRPFLAD